METVSGFKKISDHISEKIYKSLNNSPKVRHQYINGKLWVCGVGNLYLCKKECEKKREKKHERLTEFNFFGLTWFANIPKYRYKETVNKIING